MVSKGAARSRRSSAARTKPLTEAQLAEVRQLALSMSGAARSVKLHGVIVYLDKRSVQQPADLSRGDHAARAQASDGAVQSQKRDDGLNARQRRSRRRLEERIATRAAERCDLHKRPPQSKEEGAPVAKAATFAQAMRSGRPPSNPSRPAPSTASKAPPAKTPARHPAHTAGQPAAGKTPCGGSRGDGAGERGGQGGKGRMSPAGLAADVSSSFAHFRVSGGSSGCSSTGYMGRPLLCEYEYDDDDM